MGLFDLTSPLLTAVDDQVAAFIPVWPRLLIWGFIAALITMWLFRKLSRQEAIRALKDKVKSNQAKMAAFAGEFGELLPLIGATLKLAFRQLGLSLGPALLSSIPVIFLLVWLSNQFGHQFPEPGDTVVVTIDEVDAGQLGRLNWRPADALLESSELGWLVRWPTQDESVHLTDGQLSLLGLPTHAASPIIHKKQWWNALIANPAGYLPRDSAIELVRLEFKRQSVLEYGPGWMRGWMFTFFSAFLVFAIALKFFLKIE